MCHGGGDRDGTTLDPAGAGGGLRAVPAPANDAEGESLFIRSRNQAYVRAT